MVVIFCPPPPVGKRLKKTPNSGWAKANLADPLTPSLLWHDDLTKFLREKVRVLWKTSMNLQHSEWQQVQAWNQIRQVKFLNKSYVWYLVWKSIQIGHVSLKFVLCFIFLCFINKFEEKVGLTYFGPIIDKGLIALLWKSTNHLPSDQGPKFGKQIGIPPLIAFVPSITAFLLTKIFSCPSTIQLMTEAPKGTTVREELPLPCFNSIFLIGDIFPTEKQINNLIEITCYHCF